MRYFTYLYILLRLVQCQSLATNVPQNVSIFSKKNGVAIPFSVKDYNPSKSREKSRSIRASIDMKKIESLIRSTFFPAGYPEKTPPGFLTFCIWSWVQDLSTQMRAILATQRVLEGVGVGKEGATALSASINFLVRDGFGMASTLLFTALASNRFRSNVKKWRLFADVINDVGITLEVVATLVPRKLFLPMICCGNMCKALCGVAAGACNGAINLHWAKGSDISDINAKFGAQQTVSGSLGLIFAALFAKSVSAISNHTLWLLYFFLTVAHIYANMKCMKLLAFDYVNVDRLVILSENFLERIKRGEEPENIAVDNPATVSSQESIFFGSKHPPPIRMGVSFDSFVRLIHANHDMVPRIVKEMEETGYSIGVVNGGILVAIRDMATPVDRTKAYFHAIVLNRILEMDKSLSYHDVAVKKAVEEIVHRLWPHFAKSAERANWDFNRSVFSTEGYEVAIHPVT